MQNPTILVVDDDRGNLLSLEKIFHKESFNVHLVEDAFKALEILRKERIDVVLTDMKMPQMDGIELLRVLKSISPETEVVLMTAFGTIEKAVEAIKEGAYDFITKPFKRLLLIKVINKALERHNLLKENRDLREQLTSIQKEREIIGNSSEIKKVLDLINQVAASSATVLITGESGTGKELVARAIHNLSLRKWKPFVVINCAAIPETLLESELFGHEKGAFTGALQRREGRFKLADEGTIFFDEIAEMPTSLQAKLLRVLQEGEFERLGGNETIKVDVRIIASTNRNLLEMIKNQSFREDLFYRLNVIPIKIPPLRERMEDVPILAYHFLKIFCKKNKKEIKGISKEVFEIFGDYDWSGNVRELENVIERAVVLCKGDIISRDEIPENLLLGGGGMRRSLTIELGTPLEEIEQRVISETLKMTKGNKKAAAQLLGIATRTIYRKIESESEV